MKDVIVALHLGVTIAMSLLFGVGLGYLFEHQFNLDGFGMVIGIVIGTLMAFGSLFKIVWNGNDG